MHVLVDAKIQRDRRIAWPCCYPDNGLCFDMRDAQLVKFLDPVAAAGLLDIGLAAAFRLHGDGIGPQQPSGNTGGVVIIAFDDCFFERITGDQALPIRRVQDHLREWDLAAGSPAGMGPGHRRRT